MKKTVLQHLQDMPPSDMKDFALSNVDSRYAHEETHTLNHALTFGVLCPNQGDFKKIENFINNFKTTQ